MTEIEEMIRAIVRDEIRKVFASSLELSRPINRQGPRNMRGAMQKLVATVLANGPLSTTAITSALAAADPLRDRGLLANSVRNAVWTMHKKGMLIRHTEGEEEYTYSLPALPETNPNT